VLKNKHQAVSQGDISLSPTKKKPASVQKPRLNVMEHFKSRTTMDHGPGGFQHPC
jgi:hypothetical protein